MTFLRKKIFKLFLTIVVIAIVGLLSLYYSLKLNYTNLISENDFKKLVTEIKTAKPIPNELYQLFEIEYPESINNTYNSLIFKEFFFQRGINSPLSITSKIYLSNKKIHERTHLFKGNEISLSLNLDDEVNNKQCLNWLIKNEKSIDESKTIVQFLEEYYNKKIENFNINELAAIIITSKNPSLNNPYRRKEKFERKINRLITIFKKNNKLK